MRTARLLTVSQHEMWRGGGMYLPGGVPAWGVYLPESVPPWGEGCLPKYSPLWTEWLTDKCKNITFANFVCGR